MKTKYLLIIFLVSLILLVSYLYLFVYNTPHADIREATPDYSVVAMDLYEEFTTDEVVANQRYLGKIIRVRGRVLEVERREGNPSAIKLDVGHILGAVVCELDEVYPRKTEELQRGDLVTVQGVCIGFQEDVILKRCGVVEFETSELINEVPN
nr:hypothetical protein [Saprospiraceae bacterium]